MGFGELEPLGKYMDVALDAHVVTFSVHDVEALTYLDDDLDDDFDQDAKDKAIAALSKKTQSFLQHEPVLKVIRDFVASRDLSFCQFCDAPIVAGPRTVCCNMCRKICACDTCVHRVLPTNPAAIVCNACAFA